MLGVKASTIGGSSDQAKTSLIRASETAMTDYRNVLERDFGSRWPRAIGLRRRRAPPRPQAPEPAHRGGVVGIAVFVAAIWIVTSGLAVRSQPDAGRSGGGDRTDGDRLGGDLAGGSRTWR